MMKPMAFVLCCLPFAAAAGMPDDIMCVATRLCRAEVCKTTANSENGLRLMNGGSDSPSLTSDMETVPLRRTPTTGDTVQFDGRNANGGRETVAIDLQSMAFTYVRHPHGSFKGMRFFGNCEVAE